MWLLLLLLWLIAATTVKSYTQISKDILILQKNELTLEIESGRMDSENERDSVSVSVSVSVSEWVGVCMRACDGVPECDGRIHQH